MTEKQAQRLLEVKARWTFAKTMAKIPHCWIVRSDYNSDTFLKLMNFIRANSKPEPFMGRTYNYYRLNEYKYWVMTDHNGDNDPTAIINRAKI